MAERSHCVCYCELVVTWHHCTYHCYFVQVTNKHLKIPYFQVIPVLFFLCVLTLSHDYFEFLR